MDKNKSVTKDFVSNEGALKRALGHQNDDMNRLMMPNFDCPTYTPLFEPGQGALVDTLDY